MARSSKLATVDVWNPGSSALTRYMPGCRLGNVYAPESFVIVVVATPVPVLVAVIVTPGINAPLASDTLPANWPFWENAVLTMSKPRRIAAPRYLRMFSPNAGQGRPYQETVTPGFGFQKFTVARNNLLATYYITCWEMSTE